MGITTGRYVSPQDIQVTIATNIAASQATRRTVINTPEEIFGDKLESSIVSVAAACALATGAVGSDSGLILDSHKGVIPKPLAITSGARNLAYRPTSVRCARGPSLRQKTGPLRMTPLNKEFKLRQYGTA